MRQVSKEGFLNMRLYGLAHEETSIILIFFMWIQISSPKNAVLCLLCSWPGMKNHVSLCSFTPGPKLKEKYVYNGYQISHVSV